MPSSAASLGPSSSDRARQPGRLSHFLNVNGCLRTQDHAQGILCILPRFTLSQDWQSPSPAPFFAEGWGGLSACTVGAEWSAGGVSCHQGLGGDSHGGGVTASSPLGLQLPSHLAGSVLGACSECRKGGAGLLGGAKRCEAYRQHPPPPTWPGEEAPNHLEAEGRLIRLTSQRGRLYCRG